MLSCWHQAATSVWSSPQALLRRGAFALDYTTPPGAFNRSVCSLVPQVIAVTASSSADLRNYGIPPRKYHSPYRMPGIIETSPLVPVIIVEDFPGVHCRQATAHLDVDGISALDKMGGYYCDRIVFFVV